MADDDKKDAGTCPVVQLLLPLLIDWVAKWLASKSVPLSPEQLEALKAPAQDAHESFQETAAEFIRRKENGDDGGPSTG